ncbi:MAG TPA: cupin domain-containing protein [Patescibacteria group bacterium]|nr:cupin domain-containing protein [Patescibacteria group bacterium]
MNADTKYVIQTDIKFGAMEKIDIDLLEKACPHDWFNQTLCRVNDSLVRLGIFKGEFHWHQHDREDEFFFIVEGKLIIDFEDKTVELGPRQGIVVPKGVRHRPRASERTLVLMFEAATVKATGEV